MSYAYIAVDTNEGKAYLVFEELKTPNELWDVIRRGANTHEVEARPTEREDKKLNSKKPAIAVAPRNRAKELPDIIFEQFHDFAKRAEVTIRNPKTGYQLLQETFA